MLAKELIGHVVRFSSDNTVEYLQDFKLKEGVPSDVDFTIYQRSGNSQDFWLHATGHGHLDSNHEYGNGPILVSLPDLVPVLQPTIQSVFTEYQAPNPGVDFKEEFYDLILRLAFQPTVDTKHSFFKLHFVELLKAHDLDSVCTSIAVEDNRISVIPVRSIDRYALQGLLGEELTTVEIEL